MTESIAATFKSLVGEIIPCFHSEAEVSTYPYLTFDQTVTPSYDKDGEYKLVSTFVAYIVSDNFSEADTKASAVATAVHAGMNDAQYRARLDSFRKDRENGIWTIQLNYTIQQLF